MPKPTYQEFKRYCQQNPVYHEIPLWESNASKESEQHLYFIANQLGFIKIGKAKNPEKRLKELSTGSPTNLKLVFVADKKGFLEKEVHKCFEDLRTNGEWFRYTERIVSFINFIQTGIHIKPDKADIIFDKTDTKKAQRGLELMTFGKYKGIAIKDIPISYAVWFVENQKESRLRNFFEKRIRTEKPGLRYAVCGRRK